MHRTNERIRVPAVRVVLDDGGTLGVMDTRDAIAEARKRGLDLVEIAPGAQPPVAKIIDYGKFLYEQKKKQHEAKKKQVTVQVKEIKFRPGTDDHDYEYRKENARKWLLDGDKVRAAIAFRGREMSHRELGAKILKRLTEELAEYGDVEVAPKMEGYQMFTILSPKKGLVKEVKEKVHTSAAPDADEEPAKADKPRREQRQAAAPKAKEDEPKGDDEIF
ncbi:MAG: translation initiation factor IF-3 [Acidobacteria bacterium]|nr:translation initiation factor IF-3 [Acidobacteriota bacterium]